MKVFILPHVSIIGIHHAGQTSIENMPQKLSMWSTRSDDKEDFEPGKFGNKTEVMMNCYRKQSFGNYRIHSLLRARNTAKF